MLSFIIIGRNEAANLERCIRSVLSNLVHWNISAYEIIYVDSRSTDRSVQIVKQFPRIKIFYVTGECSAAVSRNIGAAEAIGTTLFFVDADMELISTFMDGVFNIDGSLKYDIITGQVVDVVDKKLTVRRHLGGTRFLSCGVFLIKKSVWQKVSGMRTKYKAGEDPDLGLRLSKKGASFHFKNEPIVKHYTIHYHDRRRVWKRLGDKSSFYYRCVLYRDHVLNSNMYRLLYSYDKTFLLFITAIGFSLLFPSYSIVFASVYLAAILARSIKQQKILSLPEFIIYYALFDIINTWYLLFFYPRSSTVAYTKI